MTNQPDIEADLIWVRDNCISLPGNKARIDRALATITALQARVAEAEAKVLDLTPWDNFCGDLPDYDHPLRPVYESGIEYAVRLLAGTLGVKEWEPCDGTEEFDGDLGGTMFNIVLAALPKDEHGDELHPNELHDLIATLRADLAAHKAAVREAVAVLEKSDNGNINWLADRLRDLAAPAKQVEDDALVEIFTEWPKLPGSGCPQTPERRAEILRQALAARGLSVVFDGEGE